MYFWFCCRARLAGLVLKKVVVCTEKLFEKVVICCGKSLEKVSDCAGKSLEKVSDLMKNFLEKVYTYVYYKGNNEARRKNHAKKKD